MAAPAQEIASPSPVVRGAVRDLLSSCQEFHNLPAEDRKAAAQAMVKVCQAAVSLMQEEADAHAATRPSRPRVLATAQEFGAAASKVAGTTHAILNAVSFPRFVTDLINGVFKAMVDSNHQQMASYVDLIKNVAASLDGYSETNLGPDQARQWLVDTFPGAFELDRGAADDGADPNTDPADKAEANQSATVRLRDGASMPSEEALRTALGLSPEESVSSGDPETNLVPFARRMIARQRQQVLASMVMMGMQRIVIESGRINAAMRFHIDTRDAASADSASKFDFQNKVDASAKFGVGAWGADARMQNTIGYVSTQKQQSTEEMNTDLDLNSSVELIFKTDYLPLDRMAGKGQVDRIKVNTINPEAEEKLASQERQARLQGARAAETARDKDMDTLLAPPPSTAPPSRSSSPSASKPAAAPASQSPSGGAKAAPPSPAAGRKPATAPKPPGGAGAAKPAPGAGAQPAAPSTQPTPAG